MEYLIATIIIATLPVFLLLYYFWRKDRGEKEPMKLMKKVFWGGIWVVFPVALIEGIIQLAALDISGGEYSLAYLILLPFLVVALPEELGKFWVVKRRAYDHYKFNEIMDGITYCILASMGFAIFENILYTIQYGVATGILRAFTAVPAHALFSGIMGYYIGMAKFTKNKDKERRLLIKGVIAGVFFHGLYDFLLLSGIPILVLFVFVLLIYMWIILHRAIRLAHSGVPGQVQELRYF